MGRVLDAIHRTDRMLASLLPQPWQPGWLNAYLFHVLLEDEAELDLNLVQPQQRTTIAHLRSFIEEVLASGAQFVTAAEIGDGLDPAGQYAWLTFDDGYANNRRALPVLEEFGVPMTLFVSSAHVLEGRGYWNDTLHREMTARGKPLEEVEAAGRAFHDLTHHEIDERLRMVFGEQALKPRGELDRPLTAEELREIAAHPLVEIGNHTRHHAVLKNYTRGEALAELRGASDDLEAITGARPRAFAYPVGYFDSDTVELVRQAGIDVAVTVQRRRNRLPLRDHAGMTLGRHIVWARSPLRDQLASYAGRVSVYRTVRRITGRDGYRS